MADRFLFFLRHTPHLPKGFSASASGVFPYSLRLLVRRSFFGQRHRNDSPLSRLAFQMGGAVVICNGVLDDGQPQPRAADGPGVALIHPVEPLKDPALIPLRDADAGIPDSEGLHPAPSPRFPR